MVAIHDVDVQEVYAAITFEERIHTEVLDIAMKTIFKRNHTGSGQAHFSLLQDCLGDLGASSHMTPRAENLILNVEDCYIVLVGKFRRCYEISAF